MKKSVYIIILNWNGWKDTIECLESIQQLRYRNYRIVLVDNGSEDNSMEHIKAWAAGNTIVKSRYVKYRSDNKNMYIVEYNKNIAEEGGVYRLENELSSLPSHKKLVIIKTNENLGFAGGCNVGIRYALASGADYIWLLNNDTVVEKDALLFLVKYLELNKDFKCATGQIRLYDNPAKIWNCGGKLTWYGARRYYYANDLVENTPQKGNTKISFITGCAALLKSDVFKNAGLLSDRFFFGEEDFEISLRMKKLGYNMACLFGAIIYHKVGASINSVKPGLNLARIYIHYLNRFINMKAYWPNPIWQIWRFSYIFYIIPMLIFRYRIRIFPIIDLLRALFKNSTTLEKVDKAIFHSVMNGNFLK